MSAALNDTLTTAAAARIAGVSERSIRGWMQAGRLPFTPTPLGRLIDPDDLDALIADREARQPERRR